jgi:hypothetical protein
MMISPFNSIMDHSGGSLGHWIGTIKGALMFCVAADVGEVVVVVVMVKGSKQSAEENKCDGEAREGAPADMRHASRHTQKRKGTFSFVTTLSFPPIMRDYILSSPISSQFLLVNDRHDEVVELVAPRRFHQPPYFGCSSPTSVY